MTDTIITPTESASGAWAELQPGVYRAVVDDIEDVGISEVYPNDGPRLRFTFALLDERDEDGNPITLYKWCSQKLTTGQKQSNLWRWATALGCPPQMGVPFAVSQLKGRECQVVIALKPRQNGEPLPAIENIIPAQRQAAPARARGAAAPGVRQKAEETCAVAGCQGVVDKYTKGGKPLCAEHEPDDL